jgi:CheY-like chemotaxis protein
MPAYSVPVANLLNGMGATHAQGRTKSTVRFTAPGVRILIVDDIMTNLKVAQGLLSAYGTRIDVCDSGERAVAMVKEKSYDLIFMDHMMPGMDGIEALTRIRALEGERFRQVPIVAMTANALAGMQEMFISKGFDDYIAKPVEISKLNALMEKWIPREKWAAVAAESVVARASALEIEGLNVKKGIAMVGGNERTYRDVLEQYCLDIEERLPFLDAPPAEDALHSFIIHVHALKGASAGIGADATAAEALLLENAGRAGDSDFIAEYLPRFRQNIAALAARIDAALTAAKP